jgi:hypothetical protein
MDVSTFGPPVLASIKASVQSSLNELNNVKANDSTKTGLIANYTAISAEIDTASANIATYTAETFPTELSKINGEISALDDKKVAYLDTFTITNDVSFGSILQDVWKEIKNNVIVITTVLGLIFGSIVSSEWYVVSDTLTTKSTLYILFYAFFGALLFPIPVVYGLIHPPMWRAPLIPLFEKDENSPDWISYPGISLFTYVAPTPDEIPTGKTILRVMCGIVVALIGLSIWIKATH